jgi:beta-barrel assembly-enhancing protease
MRISTAMAVVLAAAPACSSQQRVALETEAAKILISDEQETQIGLSVREELAKKEHVRYLLDPEVVAYVQEVSGRILPFALRERPGVEWRVSIIDDLKTVNAFATPGGFLYVHSGLLLAAEDQAEVAGVLAHECGRVVARHSARKLVDAYGLQAVLGLALGENPSLAAQIAAGIGAQGLLLAHSRSEEAEADEYGVRYASAAGFDPRGLATFFQRLLAREGGGAPVWLSDHPATPDRVAAVNRLIAEGRLGGKERNAARHSALKRRLQASLPR